MVVKSKTVDKPKEKARRANINQLIVVCAFEKTFSTGSTGWFGQVLDPATGVKYQVTGAVAIKPKS